LESGGELMPPSVAVAPGTGRLAPLDASADEKKPVSDDDPLGPLGEALDYGLGLLAAYVMEGEDAIKIASSALQAMEAHRQGLYDVAVEAHSQADSKMRHPAIKMKRGGM